MQMASRTGLASFPDRGDVDEGPLEEGGRLVFERAQRSLLRRQRTAVQPFFVSAGHPKSLTALLLLGENESQPKLTADLLEPGVRRCLRARKGVG